MKSHPSWKQALKKSEKKWGVPVYVQLAIIDQESDFKAHARGHHSSARGYAQALNEPWAEYLHDNGRKHSRNEFSSSTDFIGWYANQVKKRVGISPKNAYEFYLAYHEGIGGYHHIKRHPKHSVFYLAKHVSSLAKRYHSQLAAC